MSEQPANRSQIESRVMQRAAADQSFRQDLLRDPRQALSSELGVQIPDNVSIEVIEETPSSFVLVLPTPSQAGQPLSTQDLELVAGGWSDTCWSCANCPD